MSLKIGLGPFAWKRLNCRNSRECIEWWRCLYWRGWRRRRTRAEILQGHRENDDRNRWKRVGMREGRIVAVFRVRLWRMRRRPQRRFRGLESWSWRWSIVDRWTRRERVAQRWRVVYWVVSALTVCVVMSVSRLSRGAFGLVFQGNP